MPARSNALQRLVLLVEASLAPQGAKFVESLMLRDLTTGETREIDVAIEIPAGPRTIRIALECRDHRRPAGVQWVDEIWGKYAHLPVDRTVAVSKSGFTKSARAKAAALHIDLLTPEEVAGFDWARLSSVSRFVFTSTIRYDFDVIAIEPAPNELGVPPSIKLSRLIVSNPVGQSGYLGGLVHDCLAKEEPRAWMHKEWTDEPGAELRFRLTLDDWHYRDPVGQDHDLKYADVIVKGQVDWLKFELHAITYANEIVAHGETTLEGQPVSLVVVERKGEEPKWSLYARDTSKQHPWRRATPIFLEGGPRSVSFFSGPPLSGSDKADGQTTPDREDKGPGKA